MSSDDIKDPWVECPKCKGSGNQKGKRNARVYEWCTLCIPETYPGFNVRPHELPLEWHLARSQRPGKIRASVQYEYILEYGRDH